MALSNTNEWSSGPNTPDGELIGRNPDSLVAFYGGKGVKQPVVAAGASVDDLITALASLNIIKVEE